MVAGFIAVLVAVPVAAGAINRGGGGTPETHVSALVALGNGFTYQGRLTDDASPANGIYDLRFILYDAESGGAQVGLTVEKANVVVTNALFTTELDFGAESFDGNARWMEIAIRPGTETGAYTVLSPRQPITPVPYALFAKAAGIALPFVGSAAVDGVDGLIELTQSGTGLGLFVDRTNTTDSTNPAIFGRNAGSGAGVMGQTTYDASTAYAVIGDASQATSGVGALFMGPTAVELNGAIKVSGTKSAIMVTGASADLCDGDAAMPIDHVLANGDPTAMLFVTVQGETPTAVSVAHDVGGDCPADQWVIYGLGDGVTANVLVIKQ
jgi:hypothetical protein